MSRKVFLFVAAVAALAAAAAARFGRARGGGPEHNGGRERTEELRREIEAARARLRESIRSQEA